jgi:hypothetical protein
MLRYGVCIVMVVLGIRGQGQGEKVELMDFEWLFDDHFEENTEEEINKNIASSTEDLAILYQYEQELISRLLKFSSQLKDSNTFTQNKNVQKLMKMLERLKQFIQIDKRDLVRYTQHMGQPIRSYHLLKRATKIWPQKFKSILMLYKSLKKVTIATEGVEQFPVDTIKNFPFIEDSEFSVGCIGGILNIQRYYNISCDQILTGRLGKTEQDQTVDLEDALYIASKFPRLILSFMEFYPDSAEKLGQLDLQISWLTFAINLLERSEDTKKMKKVRKKLSEAQEAHDRYIMTEGEKRRIFGFVHTSVI